MTVVCQRKNLRKLKLFLRCTVVCVRTYSTDCNWLWHGSQTRTSDSNPIIGMLMRFIEHLSQTARPQCRQWCCRIPEINWISKHFHIWLDQRSYRFDVGPSSHVNSRKMVAYTIDMCPIPPIRTPLCALHSSPRKPMWNLRRPKSIVVLNSHRPMPLLCYCGTNQSINRCREMNCDFACTYLCPWSS